ncbi:MAG: hypothetical protein ACM31G_09165, partial [Flavobacteriales bacterium]
PPVALRVRPERGDAVEVGIERRGADVARMDVAAGGIGLPHLVGAVTLIALIIGLFSVGVIDIIHIPGINFINIANSGNTPIWLVSIFVLFAVGIPFFFLFYVGLKILINNLKSIGNIAKFTLLGLWLFSIIALVIIGIREASEHAFNERVIEKNELSITPNDTIKIKMADTNLFRNFYRGGFKLANNNEGQETLYRKYVSFSVKPTTDSIATISIEKSADGRDYEKAIRRAKNISYDYSFSDNTLLLDTFLSTNPENKFSDQEVGIIVYLPIGSIIKLDETTRSFLDYHSHGNFVPSEYANHYIKITEDGAVCEDCTSEEFEIDIDTPNIQIDENGIQIQNDENNIKIDVNGVKAESEKVKVNINSDGVSVKSEE